MSTGGPWQADRGGSLVCKVSLLTAGRNSQGWESQEVHLGPRSGHHRVPQTTRSLFCTHTLPTSPCPQTRAQSARPRHPCWFLGGSFLLIGLLLGPAQVALHLHKLGGVLLFLINFLLLQLQLQEHRRWQIQIKLIMEVILC